MGLLEKLWDDTLAGPRPDSGHGYLRKFSTFSFRSSSGKDSEGVNGRAMEDEETTKVSRQITIVRPPGYNSNQTAGSAPASPAGETPPPSPFSAHTTVHAKHEAIIILNQIIPTHQERKKATVSL